ncbi:MAG TPA: hypothetical protein VMK84_30025 [Streptosporangiaceae bacterium]|nr:hypothetical protein [Streptosporangiaceae bacterium]
MNDSVVAIVIAFFVIGMLGGVIAVIALSAVRAHRRGRPGARPEYRPGEPSEPGWEVSAPAGRPRWPGDMDNDLSSR